MGIIRKQGIKNSIITYIGIGIGFVSLIILQPLFLTTEELGLTRILFSTSYLISSFIPLGMANAITKYFPQFRNEAKNNHGFLGIVLTGLAIGATIVSIIFVLIKPTIYQQYHKESELFTNYLNWILPFSFILALNSTFNTYSASLYKTVFPSFLNDILIRIVSILLYATYYIKLINIDTLVTLFISIYGAQLLCLAFYIFKHKAFNLRIDIPFFKENNPTELYKFCFIFSLAPVASYGIKFMDGIVMGKYLPLSMVGIYSVMAFIPTFIEAPLTALEKIANPKISDALVRKDEFDLQDIYFKSCRFMMFIGGILVLLIFTNSSYLISFMKPEYMKGINVIYIISIGALFNLYTGTNGPIIFNSSNYLFGTLLLVSIMILTVFFNELFIPIWGLEGAAAATATASLLFNLGKFLFIRYKFNLQPYDFKNILIIIFTIISLCILYILPEASNIYFSAIYKSSIVLGVYLGLNYFSKTVLIKEFIK